MQAKAPITSPRKLEFGQVSSKSLNHRESASIRGENGARLTRLEFRISLAPLRQKARRFLANRRSQQMKARTSKRRKDSALLISVAKSLGSTLGTLAAKANAAQKAVTRSPAAHSVKRQSRKLRRASKSVARRTRSSVRNILRRTKQKA